MRRILSLASRVGFALAVWLGTANTHASEYPGRAVRLIVPYAAGGPTDTIARIIAEELSKQTAQRFYVENHPGASSDIGTGIAANAPPDGYTGLLVTNDVAARPALAPKLVQYDPLSSFVPVTIFAMSPEIITVHPSVTAHSMAQLVQLLQAKPGTYSVATPGAGTTTHLGAEQLFRDVLRADVALVPFNGGGPAISSTMAGHVPIAVTAMAAAAPYVSDGSIRALAVTSASRSPMLPSVPTLREGGVNGADSDVFIGLVMPAGTPPEIVSYLHQNIARSAARPEIISRLHQLGFDLVASSPEDFTSRIRSELVKWGQPTRNH